MTAMKNGRHFKVPKLKCVKVLVTQSCLTLCDPMDCSLPAPLSMEFSRQEYWSRLPFPSPGILPTQVSNLRLLLCRQILYHLSHQFSSVSQSCPTLCNPMDCSTPGLPVHHQLLKLAQTHVHRGSDAIQQSHSLSSPSPPTFNLS